MIQTTLKIEGMMCGMCEAHINNAIRSKFSVRKVTSSHTKGETTIISEDPLDLKLLEKTICQTGYRLISCTGVSYEKRSLFHFFERKA